MDSRLVFLRPLGLRLVEFMGLPVIPTITTTLAEAEALALAALAMENLALAAVINAEAEKVQRAVGIVPGTITTVAEFTAVLADLIAVDNSVARVLRDVIKKEIVLEFQLEEISALLGVGGAAVAAFWLQ